MASQSKRNSQDTSTDADEAGAGLQNAAVTAAEIGRQQLAATAEAMSTWFRAAEAIQQAQLQMGQRAALLHSQAAENIRKATSPIELATIQSTLVAYQFQETIRYWQELSMAVSKASGQMMRAPQSPADGAATAGSATASMMGAAMNAAGPMADAFQQMFTAPLKAAQQQAH